MRTSSNASLLVILGTATSFNIGTPALTQYYFITAYDFSNNESSESTLAIFTPAGTPPPVTPPPVTPPPVTPPPVTPPPVTPPPVTPPPVTPPAIGTSATSLSFAATVGVANPAPQTLSISNTGGGPLTWTASDNASWLTLSQASGTGNGAVTLNVTNGTLNAGTYSAMVTISAPGAISRTVPVTFTLAIAGGAPPAASTLGASPASLSFAATIGWANPLPQTLSISNTGGGPLTWTASENAPWLTLSQASGTGNGAVTLNVTNGTLSAGTYSATVTITASGATPRTVPVTFILYYAGTSTPTRPVTPGDLALR